MTIVILRLILFISGSNSLKRKRMVMHSLKARLRNRFNIAMAEIDNHDKWQKATLAIVGVSKDKKNIDREFSKILSFIDNFHLASILDYEMEAI